jgi:hypothetical protein
LCGITTHPYQGLLSLHHSSFSSRDEAITPKEVKLASARVIALTQDQDNEKAAKDTIEESRLKAIEHIRKNQEDSEMERQKSETQEHSTRSSCARDGNGYQKLEYPMGFTRYEGGYEMISLPMGMLMGKNLYPLGR